MPRSMRLSHRIALLLGQHDYEASWRPSRSHSTHMKVSNDPVWTDLVQVMGFVSITRFTFFRLNQKSLRPKSSVWCFITGINGPM